jgi:predicted phosphodiesterase
VAADVSVRYAVLSDVHANLHALEAVLEAAARCSPDAYLSLGDAIGYGPFPEECVERVAEVAHVCVLGNHELIALGRLSDERCTPSARLSLAWTRARLGERTRRVLADQPVRARVGPLLLAHGSPADPQEYVRGAAAGDRQLDQLAEEEPGASILLLGHTHEQWAHARRAGTLLHQRPGTVALPPGEPVLVNPGSVGQSRDRRAEARFAVVDLDEAAGHRVTFHSIRYDVAACRAALRERGLPLDSCHTPPPARLRAQRLAGRVLSAGRRRP